MRNNYKQSDSENGISLIIALGLTALLMGLILTFITSTQVEKGAAENFNNVKAAKMFAESAIRRAVTAMKAYSADSSIDISTFSSHHTSTVDDPVYYNELSEILPTTVNGLNYYEWPANYDSTNEDAVTWVYVEKGDGVDSTIIGRLAYVVISDKGKIMPSAAVDSGTNGTPYTEGNNITMIDSGGNDVVGRPGRYVAELYLNSLGSWFTKNNYYEEMSTDNATPTAGKLPVGTKWIDFATIFSTLGITDDDTKDSFRKVFNLYTPKDAEAFWIDISNNRFKESAEMYHRFNLARNDWDNLDVDSIVTDSPIPFITKYNESEVTSIPWIKNWKFLGTNTESDTMSKQIAANLIDYNDTNSSATTDDENNPTYVGLEKCPYINEIKINFTGKTQQNIWWGWPFYFVGYTCVVEATPTVETVDLYNVTPDINAEILFSYSYTWNFECSYNNFWGAPVIQQWTENITNTFNTDISISSLAENYTSNSVPGGNISPSGNNPQNIYGSSSGVISIKSYLTDFQISDLKIKLTDTSTSDFYDYSYVIGEEAVPSTGLTLVDEDSPYNTVGNLYFHSSINDPRQNLNFTDWTDTEFSSIDPGDTLNSVNDNYNPAPGGDVDNELTGTEPWNLSTAYIRNAPMKSPWELGYIHRAAIFQTINLKKYNDEADSGMLPESGGSSYIDGDANILDQIKMDAETENYGKININTDVRDVLKVLFQKIYVGSNINSIVGPGDTTDAIEVDETDANILVNAVLDVNGTNGGSVFLTRGQILRNTDGVSALYDNSLDAVGLDQVTDAKQEEIIGKFINLTKASQPNQYTIIAVGQAIKDIGNITINKTGTPVTTSLNTFDIGGDSILGTKKIMVTVQHDIATGNITILRFQILSE